DSEFWVGFGIMTALLTGLSTLAVLPVSVLILRLRHVKSGLIATGFYAVLAIVLVWGIGCSIVSASAPSAWNLAYLSMAIITGGGTLALAAVATRARGWGGVSAPGGRCPPGLRLAARHPGGAAAGRLPDSDVICLGKPDAGSIF